MADAPSTRINLITGSGVAPDGDTISIDPATGKIRVTRVPGDALPPEILGDGLELASEVFTVKLDEAPDGVAYNGIEKSPAGLKLKTDSNGVGRRYIGTDHTEVDSPLPGDIYYEIGPEV